MKTTDDKFHIETAAGEQLPTEAPAASTGHPGEALKQPIPADPIPVRDPAAAASVAGKKTVEHWAKTKGLLPEFTEGKRPPNARPKAAAPLVHNPKFAHFHAAKHAHGWPIGMELSEAEFDQAVADVQAHVYR
jgi:hypothetical protein